MSILDRDVLVALAIQADKALLGRIAEQSDAVFKKYGLSTLAQLQGFLSVAFEETGGFRVFVENMNYDAAGLLRTFPHYFQSMSQAADFQHKPEAIANLVYGGRMGNTQPGDGWRYRGQGMIQTTGRSNALLTEKLTGLPIVDHPEMLTSPDHMLECAVALFTRFPMILKLCDQGNYHDVWALVGSGSTSGRIINLQAHIDALARVQQFVTRLGAPGAAVQPALVPAAAVLNVAGIQAALNKLLVPSPGLTEDGDYGPRTKAAVQRFQELNNLKIDGWAGPQTLAALKTAQASSAAGDPHLASHDHASTVPKPSAEYVHTDQKSGREGILIDHIVLHYTTSRNIDGAIQTFLHGRVDPNTGRLIRTSAHYIVGQDGRLVQMVDDSDAAWHAGSRDMNRRSIGIEHCAAPGDRIQPSQEDTSIKLIRWLVSEYSIPQANIIPHDAVHSTDCPGSLFAAFGATHKEAVASWLRAKF
jgi:putative chitinase